MDFLKDLFAKTWHPADRQPQFLHHQILTDPQEEWERVIPRTPEERFPDGDPAEEMPEVQAHPRALQV